MSEEREKILKIILNKIEMIESDPKREKLIVDKIDVVALKEVYNEIIRLNP